MFFPESFKFYFRNKYFFKNLLKKIENLPKKFEKSSKNINLKSVFCWILNFEELCNNTSDSEAIR